MARYLVRRIPTQEVECICITQDPFDLEGPPYLTPYLQDDIELIAWEGALSFTPITPTAKLRWDGAGAVWVEEGKMQLLIDAAVARCYTDIDAVYAAAIGNRQAEYTDAEADARAFVAGAEATENVAGFARANPTGIEQSNLWSAEQIIARADAFRAAQVAMRTQRFDSQAAMRACLTPAALAHVVYLWDEFITTLRQQLGI